MLSFSEKLRVLQAIVQSAIEQALWQLFGIGDRAPVRFGFKFSAPQEQPAPGEIPTMPASAAMTSTQQIRATIDPATIVDRLGRPTSFTVPPVWASSNSGIVSVEADADGMSALFKGAGGNGPVTVTASDDADGDPATADIVSVGSLIVSPAPPSTFDMSFGSVEEQP